MSGDLTAEFFDSDDVLKEGSRGAAEAVCEAANGMPPMITGALSGGPKI